MRANILSIEKIDKSVFIFLLVGIFLINYLPLYAQKSAVLPAVVNNVTAEKRDICSMEGDWVVIRSDYFSIYCPREADFKRIERKLRKRGYFHAWGKSYKSLDTTEERIAYRMDALFNRVKELLDMRPNCPKLKIRIFSDRNDLRGEYKRIFGKDEDIKSFYVHKNRTIYISEDVLSDSVIAHEMGHAILDHYFDTIPPPKIAEMLASYVDMHLDD